MKTFIVSTCLCALMTGLAFPAAAATCPEPNKPAGVIGTPTIDFPEGMKSSPAHGTVVIRLDLSASGALVGHEYVESTGNKALDLAAFQAAHQMKFTPEIVNCKAVAGSYLFVVVFPQ